MTRRNNRLDHLLSTTQQTRLRKLWLRFQRELDSQPRSQANLNRIRAQMPSAGLSWPLWEVVLHE